MKRLIVLGVLASLAVPAAAQEGTAETPPATDAAPFSHARSDAEREAFLLEAQVVETRDAPGGVTNSTRATLRHGAFVHDAHIQIHDEHKSQLSLRSGLEMDFRDSWRNNVAAYRLDRLMGLGMVPVTVVRRDDRSYKMASFTWWVDDVLMTEKERYEKKIGAPDGAGWNRQMFVVQLFDQLIYNFDRNLGNLLIDKDWTVWMIDHTRAFKIFKDLKNERSLADWCEKDVLLGLRALEKPTLQKAMQGVLTEGQIDALLARRDKIVKAYERKIAAKGEAWVLYDLPSRLTAVPAPR
jgi:hypothetical protein